MDNHRARDSTESLLRQGPHFTRHRDLRRIREEIQPYRARACDCRFEHPGGRQWTGLLIGGINSLLIPAIGWRTAQFGFIPANLFCIGVYGLSIRPWRKETAHHRPVEDGQNRI
jgi:hypothetical protein